MCALDRSVVVCCKPEEPGSSEKNPENDDLYVGRKENGKDR